jgi:hypothetical protein
MSREGRRCAGDEARAEYHCASAGRTFAWVRGALRFALAVAMVGAPLGFPCAEQSFGQQQGNGGRLSNQPIATDLDPTLGSGGGNDVMRERRLRQFSVAQHKSMVSDTDRLLKLVTELNAEISRTNPVSLTPEELREVAAIEKLARSVKDKMRISVPDMPGMQGMPGVIDSRPILPDATSRH